MSKMKMNICALMCSTALMAVSAVGFAAPAIAQDTSTGGQVITEDGNQIIIVEGTRASIGNSIDAKRESDAIVDVLSADDAGRFPDNNIAESLSRIPGISFQRDNDTSDGEFISIRGLDASYNTVLSNGLRVGTANTFRRTPLNVVTADGVSSIYVTKAPLPEDASEGIGGVVDIRTKGALDRKELISLSAQIRENSFDDRNGFRFGGSFVKHISDRFGINVTASYRRRFFNNLQINPATNDPEILFPQTFSDANGNPIVFDDADTIESQFELIPTNFLGVENFTVEQVNYESANIRDDSFNISGTIDWEVTDNTTLTFGASYNRAKRIETISSIKFDVDNADFVDGIRTFDDPEIKFEGSLEDELEKQENYFVRGETKLDNWQFNYIVGYSRASRNNPILQIEFVHDFDQVPGGSDDLAVTFAPLTLNGPFVGPNPINQTVFDLAIDPLCLRTDGVRSCGEILDFDEEIEDSQVNERFSARLDVARFFDDSVLEYIKIGGLFEDSDIVDRDIDISTADDFLGAGGTYRGRVDIFGDNNDTIFDYPDLLTGGQRSLDPIGNPFGAVGFGGIPLFDRDALLNLRNTYRAGFLASGDLPQISEIVTADEKFYTGYLQGKLNFDDKFSIVGGVRIEKYKGNFSAPSSFSSDLDFELTPGDPDDIDLATPGVLFEALSSTDNFEILPRVVATFNFDDRMRLRVAYTTAIARPTFNLLAAGFDASFNIDLNNGVDPATATAADINDVTADFEFGNPNLRNSYSHNFDLSFEFFFDRQNAISIAAFYKRINDYIFNADVLTDIDGFGFGGVNPGVVADQILSGVTFTPQGQAIIDQLGGVNALLTGPNSTTIISQPLNGGKAEVYGIELGLLHTFSYLPGALSNFGFIGNLTLQRSNTTLDLGVLPANNVLVLTGAAQEGDTLSQEFSFFNSPELIGNATLFYEDRNLEASLSYRYSGLALEEIELFGLSQFQQGRGFLDSKIEYTFRDVGPLDRLTLSLSGRDLLDTGRRPSVFETRGEGRSSSDLATFNGRTFTFGARIRF